VTGAILSLVGAFLWAVWPPREISRWKLHEGLSSTGRTALIVVEVVLVAILVYVVTTVDASGTGQIGLIVVSIMVLLVAAALVYTVDIKRATGGKTMSELRTERQVLDSPSQPS
jgi:nicotinamide riboside transporter PnuC